MVSSLFELAVRYAELTSETGPQNDIFVSQSAVSITATAPASTPSSTAPASCDGGLGKRHHRRALGKFVEAIADRLESYDI